METKDKLSSCSNLEEQQMQQMQDKANELHETFTSTMFLNMDQLEKQLDKEEFQEIGSMYFLEYTQLEIREFHDTLIQHIEYVKKSINKRALHKREYDSRMNERQMQTTEEKVDTSKALDASLVITLCSGTNMEKQDTSSSSGNDTHVDDADIKPVYDEEPMAKEGESVVVKPHHVIASSESRNSSKNMPRFSSNDMVHNYYLDEARKMTQEKGRNSRPSVMPSARSQSTTNGSKPKPSINNQNFRNWPASKSSFITTKTVPIAEHSRNSRNFSDSKHFVCSTCQKCVFNANHDYCVTKFLNEVNSRAMSGKIQDFGLRWVPTGKIFTSSITKVDSEPPHGSNADITNPHECIQTLKASAGTSINIQEEQNLDLSVGTPFNLKKERIKP
ncbi:hypothetical protein Tco_1436509 [Tanacetum coccineum]